MYQNNFIYYNSYNFFNCLKCAFKVKGIVDVVLNINNPQKVIKTFFIGLGIDRTIDRIQQRICNRYY